MTRIAIIGCGAALEYVHRSAIDRLRRSSSLEIVAVVDPNASMRNRASQWFGSALPCLTLGEALEKEITGVMVLSPPASHVEAILEALSYGMDVFCEKPLAGGFEAISSLMDDSRTSPRLCRNDPSPVRHVHVVAQQSELFSRRGRLQDSVF